jgi:single-strand DNA-binding protein
MAGVNKVILVGNLGADPELRYTSGGSPVCDIRLATSRKYTDKTGTTQEDTQWHKVVVWGKTAEHCKNFLTKGRQIYLEGRIQTRKWQNREGQDQYTTEIVADVVQFLGAKTEGGQQGYQQAPQSNGAPPPAPKPQVSGSGWGDDDVPF